MNFNRCLFPMHIKICHYFQWVFCVNARSFVKSCLQVKFRNLGMIFTVFVQNMFIY